MASNTAHVGAPLEVVWSVLADPRPYGRFVVGTKRIRRFEPRWPDPGAALHHAIGIGPAMLRDATRVIAAQPPTDLRLHAGLGPLGASTIVFTLERVDGNQTDVTIVEEPAEGPLRVMWNPLLDRLMWLRNVELLRRLRSIAEHRAATSAAGSER